MVLGRWHRFPGLAPSPPDLVMWKDLAVGPHVSRHYSGCDKPEARAQPAGQVQGGSERPTVGRRLPSDTPVGSSQWFLVTRPGQWKASLPAPFGLGVWTCESACCWKLLRVVVQNRAGGALRRKGSP